MVMAHTIKYALAERLPSSEKRGISQKVHRRVTAQLVEGTKGEKRFFIFFNQNQATLFIPCGKILSSQRSEHVQIDEVQKNNKEIIVPEESNPILESRYLNKCSHISKIFPPTESKNVHGSIK